ncbi:MAG: TSUP family transporter, partial [Nevskiales bacterium]|nr:TSUP family transporter [Nevskiales bacterium]
PRRAGDAPLAPRPAFVLAGLLNGSLGMFVGATGLFVGRLFLRPEWRRETVIGTLALTQSFGHLLRVIAYGAVGYAVFAQMEFLLPLCVAAVAGTAVGRRLNRHVSEKQFRVVFRTLLLVLSLKLAWDGLSGLGVLRWM